MSAGVGRVGVAAEAGRLSDEEQTASWWQNSSVENIYAGKGFMSASSPVMGVGFRPAPHPLWWTVFATLLLVLTLLVLPLQVEAAVEPQRWTLTDSSGRPWGMSLFEQPDPAYPGGRRLRLTARSPGQAVDHGRPLLLSDGLGSTWTLPNRSEELVRQGENGIPGGAAQFDVHDLDPRPSEVLPLQLHVPTDNGEGVTTVMLQPEVVRALHGLPSTSLDRAD